MSVAVSVLLRMDVYLDGAWHSLEALPEESALDAMLRAGLQPPNSCREGSCGSCMCTLEDGEVRLRHNEVLDADDLAQGWTLACQAVPQTAGVKLRFPD